MLTNVDDMTAEDPPRRRWVVGTIALVVPLALIIGTAAWFVRSYVMPPSMTIAPLAFSPAVAPETAAPSAPSETTGAAAQVEPPASQPSPQPQSQFRYTTNSAEVWAAVPLPGPPRAVETPPEPELITSSIEPINGPVPLPPRRPHLSKQDAADAVPIPRPRPN